MSGLLCCLHSAGNGSVAFSSGSLTFAINTDRDMCGRAGLYHRQRPPFGADEPTASLTKIAFNINRMIGRRHDALFLGKTSGDRPNCHRNRNIDLFDGPRSVRESGDDPEVRIAMLLIGAEAHAIIHAMEIRIGHARIYFRRQVMRIRRSEYNNG
jgi:hypothetical protein